ncbi:hypothetical protein A0256_00015 [Mucilaginibacter sp. PAMC 26640]|nr:hypothetical protein A0256_00015 [Mucilaginibacter sp. PAMC 26640]
MQSMENANKESHYTYLIFTIVVGLVGVYLRFAEFIPHATLISNIILLIGSILALRAVFRILD